MAEEGRESVIGPIPEDMHFFKLVWEQEDACQTVTDDRLPDMGVKAPQCLAALGTVLSLLDRLSSCWWGCREGNDHLVEYITGRCANLARAATRLLRFGFYDESLALTRSIGEVANLFSLFVADPTKFDEWRALSEGRRKREFSPWNVRCKLKDANAPIPISHDVYQELCGAGTHVHPGTQPQLHNVLGLPLAGGYFQREGLLIALSELGRATAFVAVFAPTLAKLDTDTRQGFFAAGRELVTAFGDFNVETAPEYWKTVRSRPEIQGFLSQLRAWQRQVREQQGVQGEPG